MKKKGKATHRNKREFWLGVLFALISVLMLFGTLIFGIRIQPQGSTENDGQKHRRPEKAMSKL